MRSLKEARYRLSLTKLDMAKRLNVSLSTIKKWEQNETHLNTIELIRAAKSYEMTNYELLEYLKLKIEN